MRTIHFAVVLAAALFGGATSLPTRGAEAEGIALAIVYDTSGSMADPVPNGSGGRSPKYVIANHALEAIAARLQSFATNAAGAEPRVIQAGLFVFNNGAVRPAIRFGRFDASTFRAWARDFQKPQGGTPLGSAIALAGQSVLKSGLPRKHVLVLTDGESNIGPVPAAVIAGLQREAAGKPGVLSLHFVAFDVEAGVFAGVKRLGATVVAAADETQLNEQLGFILEKKILLEEEEPAKPK